MALIKVSADPVLIYETSPYDTSSGEHFLIANYDLVSTAYYAESPGQITNRSSQIGPLNAETFNGSRAVWASTLDNTLSVMLDYKPGSVAWSPSPAQAAKQIAAVQAPAPNILPSGVTSYAPGAHPSAITQTQFPAVRLHILPTAGYGTVNLAWFSDAGGGNTTGQDTWNIGPANLNVVMPAKGSYFQVNTVVTSPGNMTGNFYCAGVFLPVATVTYLLTGDFLIENASIVASGAVTYVVPWIIRGAATLSIVPGDTSGKLHYQVASLNPDSSSAGIIYDVLTPTAATGALAITIPDSPIGLIVTNTDTVAAHSFAGSLVPAGK